MNVPFLGLTKPLLSRLALLLLLGLPTQTVQAGWNASMSESVSYVDNVLRAPPGQEKADVENTTTVAAGLGLSASRQQLRLDLSAAQHSYRTLTDSANTSGQGALVWNWSTVAGISGALTATRSTSRYQYNGGVSVDEQAQQSSRGLAAQLRLGQGGPWSLVLGGQQGQSWYSLEQLNAQASRQRSSNLSLGRQLGAVNVQWVSSLTSTQATRALLSGQTPESLVKSSQLVFGYAHSPRTSASLSLGRSNSHSSSSSTNASAVGGATLNWQPSAKTSMAVSWQRDVGANRSVLSLLGTDPNDPTQLKPIETGMVNESVQRRLNIQLGWTLSPRSRLSLSTSSVQAGSTTLVDDLGVISLGATRSKQTGLQWTQTLARSVTLNCGHTRDSIAVLSQADNRPLRVATTSCALSLALQ